MTRYGRMQRVMLRVLAVMLVASFGLALLSIVAVQHASAIQCEYCWNRLDFVSCSYCSLGGSTPDGYGPIWECYDRCTYRYYLKFVLERCGCHIGCGRCPR